jgi:hypothetical protein
MRDLDRRGIVLRKSRYVVSILLAGVSLFTALDRFHDPGRMKLYNELESRVTQRWYGYKSDKTVRQLLKHLGMDATTLGRIVRVYAECVGGSMYYRGGHLEGKGCEWCAVVSPFW